MNDFFPAPDGVLGCNFTVFLVSFEANLALVKLSMIACISEPALVLPVSFVVVAATLLL